MFPTIAIGIRHPALSSQSPFVVAVCWRIDKETHFGGFIIATRSACRFLIGNFINRPVRATYTHFLFLLTEMAT